MSRFSAASKADMRSTAKRLVLYRFHLHVGNKFVFRGAFGHFVRFVEFFTVLDKLPFQLGKAGIDIVVHRVANDFRTYVSAVIGDGNFHFALSAEIRQDNFARSVAVGEILVQLFEFGGQNVFQPVSYTIVFGCNF